MRINFVVKPFFSYIPFFGRRIDHRGIKPSKMVGREMSKPEYFFLILFVSFFLLLIDRSIGVVHGWSCLASIREMNRPQARWEWISSGFKVMAFILGSAIAGLG